MPKTLSPLTRSLLLLAGLALPAAAQTTIRPADRYAYGANTGWIDFRPSAADGVRVTESYLSGYAYAANFGWINFGDGSPANGHTYANDSSTDYGVNFAPDGKLTGYAWAANIGWINFEQTQGLPRVNLISGKVSGSAWSANTGWIPLDTPSSDLATTIARPDTDGDGIADSWEMQKFGNLTAANASTNHDGDPQSDRQEYEADTAPQDRDSYLRIVTHSHSPAPVNSSATLSFTTTPTRLYRLEFDSDLQAPWTNSPLGTFAPDAGLTTGKTFVHASGPRMFFRAVAVLPLP